MTKEINVRPVPAGFAVRTAMSPQRRLFLVGLLSLPLLKYLPGASGLRIHSGWVLHQDDI